MFTKQKNCGFLAVHPVCSMLLGVAVTVGLGMLFLKKRHTLSRAAHKMADAMDDCCCTD